MSPLGSSLRHLKNHHQAVPPRVIVMLIMSSAQSQKCPADGHVDWNEEKNCASRNSWKPTAIKQAMIDSGASRNFVKSARGMELTGLSDKQVMAANGGSLSATHTALLPTCALSKGARESYVVPGVQESLVSVPVFSSNGYTTVFLPGNRGVKVYKQDDLSMVEKSPPVLQGWRDARGLFMVPIADKATISKSLDVHKSANSVYELPSTKEVVRFLHAALGFPTKAILLTAAKKGNLVTFPSLMPENIS